MTRPLDFFIDIATRILGQALAALVQRLLARPAPPALPPAPAASAKARKRRGHRR